MKAMEGAALELEQVNRERWEFTLSGFDRRISVVVAFVAVLCSAFSVFAYVTEDLTLLTMSLPFVGPAALLLVVIRGMSSPKVFDKRHDLYWQGWRGPDDVSNLVALKDSTPFRDIHAVQLVTASNPSPQEEGGGGPNHELNLVLADGGRIHVAIVAGERDRVQAYGASISQLLEVPLWDLTEPV
jgi:hypothetical protein